MEGLEELQRLSVRQRASQFGDVGEFAEVVQKPQQEEAPTELAEFLELWRALLAAWADRGAEWRTAPISQRLGHLKYALTDAKSALSSSTPSAPQSALLARAEQLLREADENSGDKAAVEAAAADAECQDTGSGSAHPESSDVDLTMMTDDILDDLAAQLGADFALALALHRQELADLAVHEAERRRRLASISNKDELLAQQLAQSENASQAQEAAVEWHEDAPSVVHSGFMLKAGALNTKYRRRFFTLSSSGAFMWHADDSEQELARPPRGFVRVASAAGVDAPNSQGVFTLTVVPRHVEARETLERQRVIRLVCADSNERDAWLRAFTSISSAAP